MLQTHANLGKTQDSPLDMKFTPTIRPTPTPFQPSVLRQRPGTGSMSNWSRPLPAIRQSANIQLPVGRGEGRF